MTKYVYICCDHILYNILDFFLFLHLIFTFCFYKEGSVFFKWLYFYRNVVRREADASKQALEVTEETVVSIGFISYADSFYLFFLLLLLFLFFV